MTMLSVNVNKIALLRNSRGRDFPNLCDFVSKLVNLNVKGITVHPRPDERHVTRQDVLDLTEFLGLYPDVEFNIEGYPSKQFMELVLSVRPAQCTLVPDEPGQLTSDHGWDVSGNEGLLKRSLTDLHSAGIRSSIFLDPDPERRAKSFLEMISPIYAICPRPEMKTLGWIRAPSRGMMNSSAGLRKACCIIHPLS